ncbi:MAG: cupin domain-containing protein [Methanoregulaceae archaeon]|nr:cupin domain-containing protein [Methanoregulaceae archaeon]
MNLKEKAELIQELHSYRIVAQLNDYQFKLVKAKREFVWHRHDETDELFMVVEGKMQIALRSRILDLREGELVVIPKGVDHKPVCNEQCTVLLVEPEGTLNTGNTGGALTETRTDWI